MNTEIKIATTDTDIQQCFEVLHALRPHLTKENFGDTIKGMMSRGYHLIYLEENSKAICASGYRFTEHLAWGKAIYIDDLSTLPEARKKGCADKMLDFIFEEASKNNCDEVHLDSGCNPQRYDAHRLYLKKGFNITSHHFAYRLKK